MVVQRPGAIGAEQACAGDGHRGVFVGAEGVVDRHRRVVRGGDVDGQRGTGRVTVGVDDGVADLLGGIAGQPARRGVAPGAGGEVEGQLATQVGGDVQLGGGIAAVPGIHVAIDGQGLDTALAVGAEAVVVGGAGDAIAAIEHVAGNHAGADLVEQGVHQVREVPDQDGRAAAVEIDVLQVVVVDAVTDTDGGDVDAVVVDELLPVGGRLVEQRIAALGLLVGVAVADEHDLVVPARKRVEGIHGLLDGRSEVGVAVIGAHATGLVRVEGVDQAFEGRIAGHRRVGLGVSREGHHLHLHITGVTGEQRLGSSLHGIEHLPEFGLADAAAEVQHEHHVDVRRHAFAHGRHVVLRHRGVVVDVDVQGAVGAVTVLVGDLVGELEGLVVLVVAIGVVDRRVLHHRVGTGLAVGQGHRQYGGGALLDHQVVARGLVGEACRCAGVDPADAARTVVAIAMAEGAGGILRVGVVAGTAGDAVGPCVVVQLHRLVGAGGRGVVLEADDLADVQVAGGRIAVLIGGGGTQADMARAKELGLVRIGGRVDDGAELVKGDLAVRTHGEGEHQVVAGGGTPFDHACAVDAEHHVLPAGGIHQAGVGVLHGQFVGQALQAVGTRLHVEQAAEISGGVQRQVRLVHLQLLGGAPGHAGADVVVVVVGRVGLVLPVLVAGAAGVLQVRAAGVQRGVAEQHVGTVGAGQRGAADEGLPFAAHQLEGNFRTIGQPGVGAAVGDDEEAGVRRVQATDVGGVASGLAVHVGPDHLAADRGAVVALDVVAIAVAVAGRAANEGHRGVEVQGADLDGRGVVVDGHGQAAGGRVIVLVGDLVADVEGDVVLGAVHRVHQRFQQVDGVGATGQVGQHHGHQGAAGAADGQGVGRGVPGGGHALAAQAGGPGQFDGLQPVGAGAVVQRAAGAGAGAGHIAGPAVDAAGQAFVVQHVRSGAVAGGGRVVTEADGIA